MTIGTAWRTLALAPLLLLLAACGESTSVNLAVETVAAAPLKITVRAEGELKSTKATPLNVPGRQFTPRQLAWVLPDGTEVKKGEVVAKFSVTQSKQDLAQALIDLERNLLAKQGQRATLTSSQGQLAVNLSDVATQLAIARRYANAGFEALSRNKVLDAVQDEKFLTTKQGILDWRRDQSASRGKAEMAVLDSKRATLEIQAKQKRADLTALELRAPSDGMFMLKADWKGEKPRVGATLWAGTPLANLPNLDAMEVTLAVPQVEAHGIKVGDQVVLHPRGLPDEKVTSKLSWVAQAAQPRRGDSPVKYLTMKATVPAKAVARYHWVPGQLFVGEVVLLDAKSTLSVPNVAIDSSGHGASVTLRGDDKPRAVKLGVRGAARSQVLSGLKPGDVVVLDAAEGSDS